MTETYDTMEKAMALPLNEINSITFADHKQLLMWVVKNSVDTFYKIEGETTPFEYLCTLMESNVFDIALRHGRDVVWEYRFTALYFRGGNCRTFTLATTAKKGEVKVYETTHMLTLSTDYKFATLMVPFFASGFADKVREDIVE